MKRFNTIAEFQVLRQEGELLVNMFDDKGNLRKFKTRAAAENFCKKNGGFYVEIKYIFYKPKNSLTK